MSDSDSMPSLPTISHSSDSYTPSLFALDLDPGCDERLNIRWSRPDSTTHAKFHAERELIIRSICDLRARLNLHTHVAQLPDDLVAEILDHFVSSCYELVRHGLTFRSQSRWIAPAHVCRRWRTIALSTATFWSFIFVDSPKAFSSLVARSMNAPLHIIVRPVVRSPFRFMPHLESHREGIDPVILDGIVAESHRIRELCLEGELAGLQSICKKLRQPLQSLEMLRLSSVERINPLPIRPAPSLTVMPRDGLTPHLRHVEILKLPFNWIDALFKCPSLTTLVVHGLLNRRYLLHDPPSIGTMPQLLDVLGLIAPGLRVLSLEEAIPPLPLGTTSPPPPERNIIFPFLRSLHLAGKLIDTANLFNHLSPPSLASITLKSRKSIDNIHHIGTAGVIDVARRLSQHTGGAKPFSSVQVIFADGTWHVACFRVADLLKDSPSTFLRLPSVYGGHEEMPITAFLRGSGAMFAHVQCLSITGDTFDLDWAFLIAHLPQLQSLECDGHPFGSFFEALSDVQTDESGGQHVPLPELRILRLVNVLFRRPADNVEQEFVDELLDWVILRCNYGYPLETLELGNCMHASEIDVDLLAEVVPDVGWDGWDSDGEAVEALILRHVVGVSGPCIRMY